MDRQDCLAKAGAAVSARPSAYGTPEDNFRRIADRWSLYLYERFGLEALTPADVAVMMIDLKLARLTHAPAHEDSWIDVAGYAACGAEITTAEPKRSHRDTIVIRPQAAPRRPIPEEGEP